MGYNTSPALVEDNAELLSKIKTSIDNQSALKIDIDRSDNISAMQYKVRRILAATDNHPDAARGIFHGLGRRTTVRVEHPHFRLSIEPRRGIQGALVLNLPETKKTELNIFDDLESYSGDMITIEILPSEEYDEIAFEQRLNHFGWFLHLATRVEDDDGSLSFVVERKKEVSGFDVLDRTKEG